MSPAERTVPPIPWTFSLWDRTGPYLMMMGGILAVAVSLGASRLIGGGSAGFGHTQALLALLGAGILTGGVTALALPSVVSRQNALRFLALTIQIGLVCLVIREFQVENASLYDKLTILVFGGFLFHYFLPARYRLPFFVLLSLAGIVSIMGGANSAWLIGVGLALIGICHLPIRFAVRVGLLLVAGMFLTVLRVGWMSSPWSATVWPILGSMFMFRLIIYAFDQRKGKSIGGPQHALAYFFLLPNAAFPLFPVVDYGTFVRTYYNEEPHRIYQRGVQWMFRGTVHLLLYRFIYENVMLSAGQVHTLRDLVVYLVSAYLFLLRLSGQFHLVVGMLLLFGFNLPRTFNFYYLADSFTDVWSRANIYWKEFMKKVFYFPTFFRLNKLGRNPRIVAGTVVVVLATWFLHAYQWFWILGNFRVAGPDILFWTAMGSALCVNALFDAKQPARRGRGAEAAPAEIPPILRALRIVGTFSVMCVLWSLYNASTMASWLGIWRVPGVTPFAIAKLVGVMALAIVALAAAFRIPWSALLNRIEPGETPMMQQYAPALVAPVLFVTLGASPFLAPLFGKRVEKAVRELRVAKLNEQDAALLTQGYYENLMDVGRLNSQVWEVYMKRPKKERLWDSEAGRATGDFLKVELRPSSKIAFHGASFTINRWAMRDREYDLAKPAGTFRIAMLGTSSEVGWGVADHETFEELVEDRLNARPASSYAHYEILNFAVPSYTMPQQLLVLSKKVPQFKPDAIMLIAHDLDPDRAVDHLVGSRRLGVAIPFDSLRNAVERAAADHPSEDVLRKRLMAHKYELMSWMYAQFMAMCRQQGARPVWVFLPALQTDPSTTEVDALVQMARDAGFVIVDLGDVYRGRDRKALMEAEWDYHPNTNGHRVIAEGLYRALQTHASDVFGTGKRRESLATP